MSGKRTSLASLAGARVESVPGHNEPLLVRLPLSAIVPTPLNPRRDFGGADALTELGESLRRRQLQPVVVVSRASYLRLYPEHAEHVGSASHVLVNGERRYRAARQVGLDAIEVVIREEVAASRMDFLDAVLSENIDRKNFDPIEEAHAVQAMVAECGTAAAAAERFGRTGAWVSQRVALLRLAPDVQGLVRSGDIPVREARGLAALPEGEQMVRWKARVGEREQAKTERPHGGRVTPRRPPSEASPEPVAASPTAGRGLHPVPQQAGEKQAPPPMAEEDRQEAGDQVPWSAEADAMARRLVGEFGYDDRRRIVMILLEANEREKAT